MCNKHGQQNPWRTIKTLRKVERNFSGFHYTYERVKSQNCLNLVESQYWLNDESVVHIAEPMVIRANEAGDIEWRHKTDESILEENSDVDYETKLGLFHSSNYGEFGGELILPSGDSIGGNFVRVFDYKEKVYAIDSLRHMSLGHFKLYEFSTSTKYSCLYDVGDYLSLRRSESLKFQAIYFTDDAMYILLDGDVGISPYDCDDSTPVWISRLLFVQNGKVEECLEIKERFFAIENIIVQESILYIAADKILAIVNIENGEKSFYTFVKNKAENNLYYGENKISSYFGL